MFSDATPDDATSADSLHSLSIELEKYVTLDNCSFQREIDDWDQQRAVSTSSETGSSVTGSESVSLDSKVGQLLRRRASGHAQSQAVVGCFHWLRSLNFVQR